MNLEIWFPNQDEVSVFLESSIADPGEEQFYESSFFALFAARQIANFRGDWIAQSLSAVLMSIDPKAPPLDPRERLGDVKLVAAVAGGGRKGFTAEFRPEKRAFFKLNPKGFGAMGRGVGYYAPTATLAFLAFLLERRAENREYQQALAGAAHLVGAAGMQGEIGVRSQAQVAMRAAGGAWAYATEVDTDDPSEDDGELSVRLPNDDPSTSLADEVDPDLASLAARETVVTEVGTSVALEDDDGVPVVFALIAIHDPVTPSDDSFGADSGHRYVAVELELGNSSEEEVSFLGLTAALIDDVDEIYDSALATHNPEFDLFHVLDPGETVRGFLVYELHKRAKPERFVVGIDGQSGAASWRLRDQQAEPSSVAPANSDAIEQIRRLAELRGEGVINEEEFQAKKAELLKRL